ncbi:PEGA domain-containing protein [Carboxylicivirga sp. M1479]|uniref:PEGA domain-containing protein n=1 Tax=Carboxylicivirga sp. M1479 TaxID=2594476 RepID=UPI0011783E2A|nr:PEGA domain-containing protein [Carboxylicivirga sp. M1479]TRX72634.1 PEGA domain-containing protein [Carboxylicivirga sp. M1479]
MNKLTLVTILILFTLNSFCQEKGNFFISTEPSSANIELSEFPDVRKKSPATFNDYKAIRYLLKISKRNYQTIDTIVECLSNKTVNYHFQMTPKTGSANIYSSPTGAEVYINQQKVGYTPMVDFPISCGSNVITLVSSEYGTWQQTYVVDEEKPVIVTKDFTRADDLNNMAYSIPQISSYESETAQLSDESDETPGGGFGSVGFYTMIGTTGFEGATYRYGADLFNYLRLWGESNKKSDVSGIGFEGILPMDLGGAALFLKGGVVSRSFVPEDSFSKTSINFVTLGAGVSIKPSKHFQIFGEFEFGFVDDEENEETIELWEQKYNSFSAGSAWVGIRVAF